MRSVLLRQYIKPRQQRIVQNFNFEVPVDQVVNQRQSHQNVQAPSGESENRIQPAPMKLFQNFEQFNFQQMSQGKASSEMHVPVDKNEGASVAQINQSKPYPKKRSLAQLNQAALKFSKSTEKDKPLKSYPVRGKKLKIQPESMMEQSEATIQNPEDKHENLNPLQEMINGAGDGDDQITEGEDIVLQNIGEGLLGDKVEDGDDDEDF